MNQQKHKTVVTRFAPSPTGNLHIGGARSALFNFLYAKAKGGKFLLRIDDTDLARSKPEYTDNIIESLSFLGINWDNKGHEMYQSKRMETYKQVANHLVEQGYAYKCFVPADDDKVASFETANQKKEYLRSFSGKDSEAYSVRFKMPMEGSFVMHDTINGEVEINYENLDDFTLLRQDGTATYMLASVVDDAELEITHIIRGAEHLSNTYRQIPLIMAMKYDLPTYSHVPLILNSEGQKLSKRLNAASVTEYAEMGILPEAFCNYMLRLGWGHGDVDIISMEDAIKIFDLEGFRPSPARFDMDKLLSLNSHYMKQLSIDEVLSKINLPNEIKQKIRVCIPNMVEKANSLNYIRDMSLAIFGKELPDQVDELPTITPEAHNILTSIDVSKLDYSTVENTKHSLNDAIATSDKNLKKEIMMFLRIAITGMKVSPGLFEIINALGAKLVQLRLNNALANA